MDLDNIKTEPADEFDENLQVKEEPDSALSSDEEKNDNDPNRERQKSSDEEPTTSYPVLGPAALGLLPVGAKLPQKLKPRATEAAKPLLNRRGMPVRIRKKNKLFYDDDVVNTPHPKTQKRNKWTKNKKALPIRPKRKIKDIDQQREEVQSGSIRLKAQSLIKTDLKELRDAPVTRQSFNNRERELKRLGVDVSPRRKETRKPDAVESNKLRNREIAQRIGLRLRNLLKLPKAHKWVCYEWFYSDIDIALFGGETDFKICLRESLPELKTRMLTRVQWNIIRRLMGKPRRCSSLFFKEERRELDRKRSKIRMLQQRKVVDISLFSRDLPNEIPMQLIVGTKVTARLRRPQDGLFTGVVEGVDVSNCTYRIAFDRVGLGTHSVPDFEVLAHDTPETINLLSYRGKRYRIGPSFTASTSNYSDPLLAPHTNKEMAPMDFMGGLGAYPFKLLELIVRVTIILNCKRQKIDELKELNLFAEKRRSKGLDLTSEFERRYASTLIFLESLNKDLKLYLNEVQELCQEFAPESSNNILNLNNIREQCAEDATEMVRRNNQGANAVTSPRLVELITDLTALMLQVNTLSKNNHSPYELSLLDESMQNIKVTLSPFNNLTFQDNLEMHIQHIQKTLNKPHMEDVDRL